MAPVLLTCAALLAAVLSSPALAYETDQISERLADLEDSERLADAKVAEWLRFALDRTNEQTRCTASVESTRRVLARTIYDRLAFPTYVKGRGELAGLGYGAFAAWLETDPRVDRRMVEDDVDIYDRLRPRDSLVLGTVGICSTIKLGGVLMGTDKPDHFWAQGYEYLLASREGRAEERALRWGVASERGRYGLATSGVFSYADLAANWAGYQFYKGLLGEESPMQLGEDGCVVERRPFQWAEWLDDAVDEALNPPIYRKSVGEAVRAQLEVERDALCSAYAEWGPEAAARRDAIAGQDALLAPQAPARVDEWRLDSLCGGTAGAR